MRGNRETHALSRGMDIETFRIIRKARHGIGRCFAKLNDSGTALTFVSVGTIWSHSFFCSGCGSVSCLDADVEVRSRSKTRILAQPYNEYSRAVVTFTDGQVSIRPDQVIRSNSYVHSLTAKLCRTKIGGVLEYKLKNHSTK